MHSDYTRRSSQAIYHSRIQCISIQLQADFKSWYLVIRMTQCKIRGTEETYVRKRDKRTQRYGVREKESEAISKGQIQSRAVFYHIQCHYITYIQIYHNILTSTVCYTHLGPQINHSTGNIITRQMKSNHHMPSHPNAPTAA